MTKKWPIFAGIILLTLGIVLKKTTDLSITAISLMTIGVVLKVYYIIIKIKRGEYTPGREFLLLLVGLIIFFSGLYLRYQESAINPSILIFSGISLKVAFIVIFIRKSRYSATLDRKGNP